MVKEELEVCRYIRDPCLSIIRDEYHTIQPIPRKESGAERK
jgi:hypothetical protein